MVDELKNKHWVVLFHSTSLAIRAEKVCKKTGIKVKLIPTPRHLSSDCGIALRFHGEDREKVLEAFSEAKLEYERIAPL
ncbi:MAG TPA: DUF3343 domain-containing protein [Thermoplasmata archaeon]|nr:DUF3343 domain-containing protein [Thermoplasmata archaeon]